VWTSLPSLCEVLIRNSLSYLHICGTDCILFDGFYLNGMIHCLLKVFYETGYIFYDVKNNTLKGLSHEMDLVLDDMNGQFKA
jgi:hypothetical protein